MAATLSGKPPATHTKPLLVTPPPLDYALELNASIRHGLRPPNEPRTCDAYTPPLATHNNRTRQHTPVRRNAHRLDRLRPPGGQGPAPGQRRPRTQTASALASEPEPAAERKCVLLGARLGTNLCSGCSNQRPIPVSARNQLGRTRSQQLVGNRLTQPLGRTLKFSKRRRPVTQRDIRFKPSFDPTSAQGVEHHAR